ncbi:MAG: MATE family efflux transporter [Lachnospiraceae bacterium]|nr:MATE family efflux transporter [Lachnospiraceae bacterium]MDY4969886.1 MATE family efflux transporter [Lachnospiraceae bacterium]
MKISGCFKDFAKYSSLNVLGMIGLSCYILADTFFIANGLGANGLAALNLAIPVYSFVYGSGLMLGMGGATRYSISGGRKEGSQTGDSSKNREDRTSDNHKLTDIIFTNTIYAAVALALIFIVTGTFLSGPIARLLGADAQTFAMTKTYIHVVFLFSPAFIMNNILICFVRNDGAPKLAMFAMLMGSFFNIVFDYIFIFPLQMGILGAVLATGFSPVVGMLILSLHLIRRKNHFHLVKTGPRFSIIASIFSLGLPTLVTELSSGIVIIVFNIIILGLEGNTGVAAYGVVANISLVVASIFTGMAQGVQPLISRAFGRGEKNTIRQVLRYALITVCILSCLIYALVFFFTSPIVQAFNSENDPVLREIALKGMKLYFTAAFFMGFNTIISVFFTSMEKAAPAQLISLLRGLFVIIPTAFIMSWLFGITGVWLAFPATEMIVAAVGAGIYLKVNKK